MLKKSFATASLAAILGLGTFVYANFGTAPNLEANRACVCCTDCKCVNCTCDENGCACDQGGLCYCDAACCAGCCSETK
jgi:hypothetical protein